MKKSSCIAKINVRLRITNSQFQILRRVHWISRFTMHSRLCYSRSFGESEDWSLWAAPANSKKWRKIANKASIHQKNQVFSKNESILPLPTGGTGRNRTADEGFADPCLTTWLPCHLLLVASCGNRIIRSMSIRSLDYTRLQRNSPDCNGRDPRHDGSPRDQIGKLGICIIRPSWQPQPSGYRTGFPGAERSDPYVPASATHHFHRPRIPKRFVSA